MAEEEYKLADDLWVHKYAPQTFQDAVGNQEVLSALQQYVHDPTVMPNFLLAGPPGCGKTTSMQILWNMRVSVWCMFPGKWNCFDMSGSPKLLFPLPSQTWSAKSRTSLPQDHSQEKVWGFLGGWNIASPFPGKEEHRFETSPSLSESGPKTGTLPSHKKCTSSHTRSSETKRSAASWS
jgi:hypothetical protein